MNRFRTTTAAAAILTFGAAFAIPAAQQPPAAPPAGQAPPPAAQGRGNQPAQPMTFFVTSVGLGKGANLGGLAGADAHCQALAHEIVSQQGARQNPRSGVTHEAEQEPAHAAAN